MDTTAKDRIRESDTTGVTAPTDGGRAQRVNRWLVAALVIVTVIAVGVGAALVAERGSQEPVATRSEIVEPTAPGPAAGARADGVSAAAATLLADFEEADRRLEEHVDSSMLAYRRDEMEHFRTGYSGSGGFGNPSYFRLDQAQGQMVRTDDVLAVVGTRDVERISPVVLVAGSADSGSWTVAFAVRAGTDEQLWIQHWEEPWGEVLQQMWVI